MKTCDALIVGGGPAGSTCARQLSQQGMKVIVMDKAVFPRDKVCAGWITPEVVRALDLDLHAYAYQRVFQPITAFRTGLIDGESLETRYPAPVSYGIRRREFDDYLLRRSGANLWLGQALKSMERQGKRWVVNYSLSTPLIIGAGGHFCPVARFLGAKLGAEEAAVAAKEIEFEMNLTQLDRCQVRPDTPELYFCRDFKGYGWCIRKGRYLNVGLGREGSHRLADELKHFCDFLKRSGSIPEDIPDGFHGHAYLLYGKSQRKLLDHGVLLVGDAAGLASPQSGEGIRPAVESGLMAATTVLEAREDYHRHSLAAYHSRLQARFGSATPSHPIGPEFLRTLISGALLDSRWFTRHVVLDRWFLQTHQKNLNINWARFEQQTKEAVAVEEIAEA